MTVRLAKCVGLTLFLLAVTTAMAGAQGRGGRSGNIAGGPVRMAPAPRPVPVIPPVVAAPPAFNRRVPGPVGQPSFGGHQGGSFVRRQAGGIGSQPRVILTQPYLGFYNPYSYSAWPGSLYADPAYVAPSYAAPSASQSEVDLAYEVERLTREVEQLRQDQVFSTARQLAPPPPPPAPVRPPAPIALVFTDGHRLSIQNYAIVGQTLWVLDEQNSTRIPLSDLDLDATRRANPGQALRLPLPSR